jgi:drug/metabolite transporter superfamily protein YnfA
MRPTARLFLCILVNVHATILSMEILSNEEHASTSLRGDEDDEGEPSEADAPTLAAGSEGEPSSFQWTAQAAILSVVLFIVAGVCEIGGGWLVWKAVREGKPYWWAIVGSAVLVGYGFIPTLQPTSSFGRLYAVYGGFFIVLSFLWGWWFDGDRPDAADSVGSAVALVGVLLVLFWPR